jgi:hypothetical protein
VTNRLATVAIFLSLLIGLIVSPPYLAADAHGTCTLTMGPKVQGFGPTHEIGWMRYSCGDKHYRYQARVLLQRFQSGSWITVDDSGVVGRCCNLRRIYIEVSYPCQAVTPQYPLFRVFTDYVTTISSTGNPAHRLDTVASAPWNAECLD